MSEVFSKLISTIIKLTPLEQQDVIANSLLKQYEKTLELDLDSDDAETRTHVVWYKWNRDLKHGSPKGQMSVEERIWYLLEASPDQREDWIDLLSTVNDVDNFATAIDPQIAPFLNKATSKLKSLDAFINNHSEYTLYREQLFEMYTKATEDHTRAWTKDKVFLKQVRLAEMIGDYNTSYSGSKQFIYEDAL